MLYNVYSSVGKLFPLNNQSWKVSELVPTTSTSSWKQSPSDGIINASSVWLQDPKTWKPTFVPVPELDEEAEKIKYVTQKVSQVQRVLFSNTEKGVLRSETIPEYFTKSILINFY